MFSLRSIAVTLLTAALAAAAAPALADDRSAPFASPSAAAAVTRDGGVIDGTVTNVNYQRRILTVAAKRGSVDISVPPTVPVQGSGNAYQSLNDVKNGQHVQVYTSQKGSSYTAQIINLCQKSCP